MFYRLLIPFTLANLFVLAACDDLDPEASAEITINPQVVNFGLVPAGISEQRTIEIVNTGSSDLILRRVTSNGSSDFQVELGGVDLTRYPSGLNDPDQDGIPGLAPGNSVELTIIYEPESDGPDTGILSILSSDSTHFEAKVQLVANGG